MTIAMFVRFLFPFLLELVVQCILLVNEMVVQIYLIALAQIFTTLVCFCCILPLHFCIECRTHLCDYSRWATESTFCYCLGFFVLDFELVWSFVSM